MSNETKKCLKILGRSDTGQPYLCQENAETCPHDKYGTMAMSVAQAHRQKRDRIVEVLNGMPPKSELGISLFELLRYCWEQLRKAEHVLLWNTCCPNNAEKLDQDILEREHKELREEVDRLRRKLSETAHERDKALMYLEEEKEARLKMWQKKRLVERQFCELRDAKNAEIRALRKIPL